MAKQIRRMEIEPADGKGFAGATIRHHFKESPQHSPGRGVTMAYQEPEHKVFGASEGHEMLAHIANHLEIPEGE